MLFGVMISALSLVAAAALSTPATKTQNVVFMMADGLRWQELFTGADKDLLDKVEDKDLKTRFWAATPELRREALMPFVWGTIAKNGLLLGNRTLGSECQVTNPYKFSYPGYSETLCGYVDRGINSNNYRPNPNVTVFEWLSKQPTWKGGVAAFGAWNVISAVFNKQRCGFVDNAGYEPLTEGKLTPGIEVINMIKAEQPRYWDDEPFDVLAFRTGLDYLKVNKPRLCYISLGEPDDWAHEGKYDKYLTSIKLFDQYVQEVWTTLQSMPQYKGKTTLVLTCDHGRGLGSQWTSHGTGTARSEETWIAFMGPDTPSTGESKDGKATNNQIAATIAKLLGYDYKAAQPKAGDPIIAALPN